VELTSLHEQAFLYWTLLLGKKIAKRWLCCDTMGAPRTFYYYKRAILIGPSAIFCEHWGHHWACPQQKHLCDKIETNVLLDFTFWEISFLLHSRGEKKSRRTEIDSKRQHRKKVPSKSQKTPTRLHNSNAVPYMIWKVLWGNVTLQSFIRHPSYVPLILQLEMWFPPKWVPKW
jgi:hypothetical protein